ncbi:MAG: hypothetical protein ABW007_04385 [Chitinophagaceae bacterium]
MKTIQSKATHRKRSDQLLQKKLLMAMNRNNLTTCVVALKER